VNPLCTNRCSQRKYVHTHITWNALTCMWIGCEVTYSVFVRCHSCTVPTSALYLRKTDERYHRDHLLVVDLLSYDKFVTKNQKHANVQQKFLAYLEQTKTWPQQKIISLKVNDVTFCVMLHQLSLSETYCTWLKACWSPPDSWCQWQSLRRRIGLRFRFRRCVWGLVRSLAAVVEFWEKTQEDSVALQRRG